MESINHTEELNENLLSNEEIKVILEALLFIYGEPLTANELRDAINPELNLRTVKKCLDELIIDLESQNRGVKIYQLEDKYQMGTDKRLSEYVERLVSPHKKKTLTRSAIETLTMIAYKQPITRVEIEDIRGVKSSAVFETLLNHDLIAVAGTAKKIGNPKLYKTTDNFLKALNIKSLDELPDLEKHQPEQMNLLERLKNNN